MSRSKISPEMEKYNLDISRRFVRVTGEHKNGFIEFDYAVGEPEVFVELVLPSDAFEDFCEINHVELLPSEHTLNDQKQDWEWRISDATKVRIKSDLKKVKE